MTDAKSAVEAAAYAALSAGVTLAPVWQHAPQDVPPPVVIIGDMDDEPIGTKDDPDRRVSVSILTVVEGEERRPVFAIQAEITAALDGKTLTSGPWSLRFSAEASDAALLGDGSTYLGTSRFLVMALR